MFGIDIYGLQLLVFYRKVIKKVGRKK